jgi:hypothetical protein
LGVDGLVSPKEEPVVVHKPNGVECLQQAEKGLKDFKNTDVTQLLADQEKEIDGICVPECSTSYLQALSFQSLI